MNPYVSRKAVDLAVENGLVQQEWLEYDPMYLTD